MLGVTMLFKEGNLCRQTIEFLIDKCDYVLLAMTNYDEETLSIAKEYSILFPDKVFVVKVECGEFFKCDAELKKHFIRNQSEVRENVIGEIRKFWEGKKFDILTFIDSDEVFSDSFDSILEKFWNSDCDRMMVNYATPYDGYDKLVNENFVKHARVFKYNPEMSALPVHTRTRYNGYKKDFKARMIGIHLDLFDKERRAFREMVSGRKISSDYRIWDMGEDVRKMSPAEILGKLRGSEGIRLEEYLKN
jgi:hypothetical protein